MTLFEDYLDYWTDVFQTITSVDVLIKENYFRILKSTFYVLSTLIGHKTADNLKIGVKFFLVFTKVYEIIFR